MTHVPDDASQFFQERPEAVCRRAVSKRVRGSLAQRLVRPLRQRYRIAIVYLIAVFVEKLLECFLGFSPFHDDDIV